MLITGQLMLALRTQSNERYIESVVTCFAAPVIKGLKCGGLLNISRKGEDMAGAWLCLCDSLMKKLSLEAVVVSCTERSVLVLIYNKKMLMDVISSDRVRGFLADFGYPDSFTSVVPHLRRLISRFADGVPHEVGVFLGYPLDDVIGFIENNGKNSLLTGYWKVYGNRVRALEMFREYRRAEFASAWALLKRLRSAGQDVSLLKEDLPAA